MSGRLVILAGGISSRMKKPAEQQERLENRLVRDADEKAKSMIGVGKGYRPFLDYLLYNAREAGYDDVVMVINRQDNSIREYYGLQDRDNDFYGLRISYAIQEIPTGRSKPLGTADALQQALEFRPDWAGGRFTVSNSDNLYSQKALKLLRGSEYENAMIEYDRSALEFSEDRIRKFAVVVNDSDGTLQRIVEKPSPEQVEAARSPEGKVGVSMNVFMFTHDQIAPLLPEVPLDPDRDEKELPTAVNLLVQRQSGAMHTYFLSEHVPDLTYKSDIGPVKKSIAEQYNDVEF